jgi:hypothetical protein
VARFEHVSSAVTQANTLRAGNAAIILVGALCIYLLFAGELVLRRPYIHIVPLGGLITIITWFIRFGSLKTKDPEFEPARREMKKSLLMWSIALVVYFICVIVATLKLRA